MSWHVKKAGARTFQPKSLCSCRHRFYNFLLDSTRVHVPVFNKQCLAVSIFAALCCAALQLIDLTATTAAVPCDSLLLICCHVNAQHLLSVFCCTLQVNHGSTTSAACGQQLPMVTTKCLLIYRLTLLMYAAVLCCTVRPGPALPCAALCCVMQLKDLAATIAAVPCDSVLLGTPHDLTHLLDIPYPVVSVTYDVADVASDVMAGVADGAQPGSATELVQQVADFVKAH